MKKIHISLLFLSIGMLLNNSCSKNNDSTQREQQIITKLFPEIFEYSFEDSRKRFVPPPPPASDSNEELEKMHMAFDKAEEDHKTFLDTTEFATLFVIVYDSLYGIPKRELKRIYEEDNPDIKFIDTTVFKKSFRLDLSKVDLAKGYIIKGKSDYSSTIDDLINEEWRKYPKEEIHLHQFTGQLSLSRIYFNKEQTYGFLNVSFSCGSLCGCGYRFFIRKVSNKWIIYKIDDLGCS